MFDKERMRRLEERLRKVGEEIRKLKRLARILENGGDVRCNSVLTRRNQPRKMKRRR